MDINKALTKTAFKNREYMITHLPYEREMEFYQSVKMGNIKEVNRLFKPLGGSGFGRLSDDDLRNLKYHLIVTIAFITRYCIEGGMEMETAYNLSDIYILRTDRCVSEEEIRSVHRQVVDDFTGRMHAIIKKGLYSKPVLICLDLIYDNLHNKITLNDLADNVGLSAPYLSKLFHKEVGVTVSQYISQKRVEAAENLLKFSDYSCIEISNYLCFNSESYFIQVFKSYTKLTPKEYREKFFRTRWGG
ncbi:MAG: AraC family transcriptional regulator [Ruminococcaceae bacterium]|nr:AraC family transcriptional regulator [Oscillospiraceae bacterium]